MSIIPVDETQLQSRYDELYEQLNTVGSAKQALLLPIVFSISLALSYVFLFARENNIGSAISSPLGSITGLLDFLIILSNIAVAFLFTKIELQGVISTLQVKENAVNISIVMAALFTLLAFTSPPGAGLWPLHNIINACITIAMARAIQLPQLSNIIIALTGLTVYDFIAVIGTRQFTDGGASIMESVAKAKVGLLSESASTTLDTSTASTTVGITSSFDYLHTLLDSISSSWTSIFSPNSWRPGLFEVGVGGHVSDVLGLADVLFPALLTSWALRFDSSQSCKNDTTKTPTFSAALNGFLLGCFLCEVFQTGQGQPALVYIVPSSLIAVALSGLKNKNIREMWEFGSQSDPPTES